ncbi:transporter substrate-binding domain-containing protein [Propionispira raffinosivorans]|uniref:transporter substrate-binding domain-containing protein n=1 Tax=Propionispira raffinosivorans TaxID=86959 RepID=UPI00035C7844|nr:transporter substrate-binding domain-containing protein [Propionispira raffinosivorans]
MKIRYKIQRKLFAAISLLLVGIILAAGCGSDQAASSGNKDGSARKKIVVATGGQPKPFSYVNENNEITGYDIETVKAIFEKLPQYELSFEKTEFPSIFAGLDSDRYQIGANNFAMNKERKEKYIYSKPIFKNQYVIAVAADNKSINSFKDLQGKTTEVSAGTNYTTALENYNKEHTSQTVLLNYTEADLLPILQNVESGKYDFQLIDAAMLENYIKDYGLKLKTISLTAEESDLIGAPYSYLLISKGKDGEQLEKDINQALAEVIADGTITKISQKYFHNDYAPK